MSPDRVPSYMKPTRASLAQIDSAQSLAEPENLDPLYKHYNTCDVVRQGGEGGVILARHKTSGELVAIKTPIIGKERHLKDEYKRLKQVAGHPRILPVVEYFDGQGLGAKQHLVLPYCSGGDLEHFNNRWEKFRMQLPEPLVFHIFHQMAQAVEYLHETLEHPVVHLDIKPANWLVKRPIPGSPFPDILLADFGLARTEKEANDPKFMKRGTYGSVACQPVDESRFTKAADIWAVGASIQWLCTGRTTLPEKPYEMDSKHKDRSKIKEWARNVERYIVRVDETTDWKRDHSERVPYSARLQQIVSMVLVVDPTQRIRAGQLVKLVEEIVSKENFILDVPLPFWCIPDDPPKDWGSGRTGNPLFICTNRGGDDQCASSSFVTIPGGEGLESLKI